MVEVLDGDCRLVLSTLEADSFDSAITDPPYELGFMGKSWDRSGVAFDPATWAAVYRVLKPGAYLMAMGGTRTYHRLTCAIEDAGFEIRDCLMWIYGSGFPKHKACLKPAYEPIVLARKPGPRSTPLNIDDARVPSSERAEDRQGEPSQEQRYTDAGGTNLAAKPGKRYRTSRINPGTTANANGEWRSGEGEVFEGEIPSGRWPANVLHDGSAEVMEAFAAFGEGKGAQGKVTVRNADKFRNTFGEFAGTDEDAPFYGDTGSAARFFYCAKASRAEREAGNNHPTVKPLALMRYLVRLVTPAAGRVLDPFGGSGSTGKAAAEEGRGAVLIELNPEYAEIARRRTTETGLFAGIVT